MSVSGLYLDELFLSLQGEAVELGRPQLFLRLAGCPLRCNYCDTPRSWQARESYERHEALTSQRAANPLDAAALDGEIAAVLASHEVAADRLGLAVTGGEPLEQDGFLADWLPRWPGPVMLETAGIHAARLESLLPLVESVSLDWKLASTLRAGVELLEPAACLRALVAAGTRHWVKLVVTAGTSDAELAAALTQISAASPAAPVYLQPVTPFGAGPPPPPVERLLGWALRHRADRDLRVVPQMHPAMGIR